MFTCTGVSSLAGVEHTLPPVCKTDDYALMATSTDLKRCTTGDYHLTYVQTKTTICWDMTPWFSTNLSVSENPAISISNVQGYDGQNAL